MNEIKKCPFCGGEPTFEQVHKCANSYPGTTEVQIIYSMKCETCGYEFGREATLITVFNNGEIKVYEDGHKKLVERWNTRAEEPQEKKETRFERLLKEERQADELVCCLAYRDKHKGKNCNPFNCGECEFYDPKTTIDYLLAPCEGKDDFVAVSDLINKTQSSANEILETLRANTKKHE